MVLVDILEPLLIMEEQQAAREERAVARNLAHGLRRFMPRTAWKG